MFCSTLGQGRGRKEKNGKNATFPTLLTMIVVKTTLGLIYLYFQDKILELSKYSNYRKITKYTGFQTLTQGPEINKL